VVNRAPSLASGGMRLGVEILWEGLVGSVMEQGGRPALKIISGCNLGTGGRGSGLCEGRTGMVIPSFRGGKGDGEVVRCELSPTSKFGKGCSPAGLREVG
jgi:hypothetical protein